MLTSMSDMISISEPERMNAPSVTQGSIRYAYTTIRVCLAEAIQGGSRRGRKQALQDNDMESSVQTYLQEGNDRENKRMSTIDDEVGPQLLRL